MQNKQTIHGQVYVELRLYDEVLQIRALWISAKAVVPPQDHFRESAVTDFRNKAPESTDRRDLPSHDSSLVLGIRLVVPDYRQVYA